MTKKQQIARLIFFLLGLIMLIIGISSGGYRSVMRKAILLCYECIGIG